MSRFVPIPSVEMVRDPTVRAILIALRENIHAMKNSGNVTAARVSSVSAGNTPTIQTVTPSVSAGGTGGGGGTVLRQTVKAGTSSLADRIISLSIVCDSNSDALLDSRGHPIFTIEYGEAA